MLCASEMQARADIFPGLTVVHAPNEDGPDIEERFDDARAVAAKVVKEHRRGGKVLVTCAAGLNCSGLVTTLALAARKPSVSIADHVETLREARPGALSNPHFVKALEEWQASRKRRQAR